MIHSRSPLVIAHRGGPAGHVHLENKLPAFEHAMDIGADLLECDVHQAADGEVVVIHDRTLDRTTTGRGLVNAYTAAELGAWKVPTLRALCRLARGRARLLIEIKSASPYRVVEAIVAEQMQHEVVVFSLHPEYLRPIARLRPDIHLAVLLERFGREVPNASHLIRLAAESEAKTLAPNWKLCTQRLVTAAHAAELSVFAWTVNAPRVMRRLTARRVDGIITNYPERLLRLLQRHAAQQRRSL